MKKELRINEIMREFNVDYDTANAKFQEEICNKYGTDDLKLAEEMFYTDQVFGKEKDMYISPFWCGVGATLIVEVAVIIAYGIYLNSRKKKR